MDVSLKTQKQWWCVPFFVRYRWTFKNYKRKKHTIKNAPLLARALSSYGFI